MRERTWKYDAGKLDRDNADLHHSGELVRVQGMAGGQAQGAGGGIHKGVQPSTPAQAAGRAAGERQEGRIL